MAKIINFDAVAPLVDNTQTINSVVNSNFIENLKKLADVLKNTEQTEPIIGEIMVLSGVMEEHFNALVTALNTHRADLMTIEEIAEVLKKRETGVQINKADEVGVATTARVDALKNL